MKTNTVVKNRIKYYRASLLDGCRGKVKKPITFKSENKCPSAIPKQIIEKTWMEENEFEADDKRLNRISVCPFTLINENFGVAHSGLKNKSKRDIFPFWIPFYSDKEGNLSPPQKNELPYFTRENLEPTTSDVPIVGY